MNLTLEQKRKLKNAKTLLSLGVILSPIYAFFADGFTSITPYINALIIAILLAGTVAFSEFILFTGKVKKIKFYQLLLFRVLLYTTSVVIIITVVMIVSRMFRFNLNFQEVLNSKEFKEYIYEQDYKTGIIYALSLVGLVVFTLQMQRKIGPKVLVALISGKYKKPKKVERIVLFIELQSVKYIIEKNGRIAFFNFLNDIIFDISENIIHRKGEIYEYIENQILITWDIDKGIDNANCIRVFFEIKELIEANKIYYFEQYATNPILRASLHAGTMVQGVIGEIKSEIKFYGDTMNTGARILGQTTEEDDFLISEYLLEKIDLPAIYQSKNLGNFELKGKKNIVKIFSLSSTPVNHL